jgi:hypothetical protein
MKMGPFPVGVLVLIGLAGCASSPPAHYYALTTPTGASASGSAQMLVEVLPVTVPERVNRSEMVLTGNDGSVDVRGNDLWAAPLSDEIGQMIDDTFWRSLRAADVYNAPVAPVVGGPPQYRLALRIERFDAGPGPAVAVSGSWTLRRLPQGPSATCRADLTASLPSLTPESAAAALAQTSGRLATMVAESLGRLDHGTADVCADDAVSQ